jgi:transposase
MTAAVVGVDIAKATFDVALPLEGKSKYQTRSKMPNDPRGFEQMANWLARHAPAGAVCMEATGIYHEALATFLVTQGYTVYVVNPAQVAFFAKSELSRTKTDRTDAKLIARFAAHRQLSDKPLRAWQPPTPAQRKLRALVYRLDELTAMRQMEFNRRESADATVHASIDEVVATLDEQIKVLRRQIDDHIQGDPPLQRDDELLRSIPGIAQTTSAWLLASGGDLRRFDHPGKLAAFAGLNPTTRESGTWKGRRCLSKIGHATLRAKLYMPAVVAQRYNPSIKALVDRLLAKGKPRPLALGAAMRKLLHIAWGVIRSGKPFDPAIALAPG